MRTASLTITGRIPSKKNSRNIFVMSGRQMNLPSSKYREWAKKSTLEIRSQPRFFIFNHADVQLEFWMPDNRACDLTNKAESVMDLLVDCGVLSDDSWQVVPEVHLSFRGVDKKNPRVIIWIKEREKNEKNSL